MKILILGKARHGKDTVAELLHEYGGYTFQSSSMAALEIFLFKELNRLRGWTKLPKYATHEEAYEDRVNHRQLWFEFIKDYNKEDGARLTKAILDKYDVYVGMRNIEELHAAAQLFDLIIWVDATDRLGDTEGSESMTITRDSGPFLYLDNNGTLADLQMAVIQVVETIDSAYG